MNLEALPPNKQTLGPKGPKLCLDGGVIGIDPLVIWSPPSNMIRHGAMPATLLTPQSLAALTSHFYLCTFAVEFLLYQFCRLV